MLQECPLIVSRSYIPLKGLIGVRVAGHMTLRAFIYLCGHHRTKPRHQSLSCPYPFDGFGYPQDFAGGFEQFQFPADTHLA